MIVNWAFLCSRNWYVLLEFLVQVIFGIMIGGYPEWRVVL